MRSLKALLLEKCEKLEKVPYLGNLKALRELNFSGTAIKEVPQGLDELISLKFISMDARALEMLPKGLLLKLEHLQHVILPFHIQVPIEEIENLKQLEVFCGRMRNVNDFNCFVGSQVHGACSYTIGVGSQDAACYILGKRDFGSYNKELILSECNLKDEKVSGQSIVYLTVRECEGISICFLDHFTMASTSLKVLKITSCEGVECILSSDEGLPSRVSTLEELELEELEDLKVVIQRRGIAVSPTTQAVFSSLRKLVIEKCDKMSKMGIPVFGVPNLETIAIWECGDIEEIFEDEGRGFVTFPKLKELRLYRLPRLNCICNATMICNSIEVIGIGNCPRLIKILPMHFDVPPPVTFREIRVERKWWRSLEWENPNLPQLLQPFLV